MSNVVPQSDVIIQIDNVHKSYVMGKEAVPALRGVSLDIRRGEMVCLMGPSGSGKTTLLNITGGLDSPGRGHVTINGHNIVSMKEEGLARLRLASMGFVFQTFNLLSNFTALENVEAPMVLLGKWPRRERKARAEALLTSVGLGDRMEHYPSELSGGQQQRVAIARALANDPAIVIGDEMTGDLDSATGFEIMTLVRDLKDTQGKTIVYVTHDPRMAEFADYTVHLLDGRIVDEEASAIHRAGGQHRAPEAHDDGASVAAQRAAKRPAAEPRVDPVVDPVVEPVGDPVGEPVGEPVAEPTR